MTTTIRPPMVDAPVVDSPLVVEEIDVNEIQIRYRLRTPKEQTINEIANSIRTHGLLNPITIDSKNFLIAGFHRLHAYKLLGLKTIPAIKKDTTRVYGELMEISENIDRAELNVIEVAEHMVRREELLGELGVRMPKGGNQYTEGMVTTTELAEEVGMSNRYYRLKKQPAKIIEEAKDLLRETKFADNLMDMVKLSQQTPAVQLRVSNLLITGKLFTFKRALAEASVEAYNQQREFKVDFDLKGRWGIPQTIMRFKKADVELQKVCDLISKDPECELIKRKSLHFGTSKIPLYGMAADHAEFLVTYYTPENGIILDCFQGRGTIGLAALWHGRRYIGFDVQKNNINRMKEVIDQYLPHSKNKYEVHHSDGVSLKELKDKSNYLDAVITDPPYVLNAERYSEDDRDISHLNHQGYMEKIEENFHELFRLIKKSDFEKKEFYPVIFKVGMGRKGSRGIVDMDADFQYIAKKVGFCVWDKLFNQLASPWAAVNWERNYVNRYVQKNMETNLVFCKF